MHLLHNPLQGKTTKSMELSSKDMQLQRKILNSVDVAFQPGFELLSNIAKFIDKISELPPLNFTKDEGQSSSAMEIDETPILNIKKSTSDNSAMEIDTLQTIKEPTRYTNETIQQPSSDTKELLRQIWILLYKLYPQNKEQANRL